MKSTRKDLDGRMEVKLNGEVMEEVASFKYIVTIVANLKVK